MTNRNPWLGLASYEEPNGTADDYLFCGRDEETMDVVRLIDNNLFITLYGSSGIGKTSLLRAGVIPILKRKDYFPLYVRLSQEPKEISYAEAIIRRLQGSGLSEERIVTTAHFDSDDRRYLWEYFATTHFLNNGREVYPVIILDQFEEVFREDDKAKAEMLLKQIYLLLNDELEMPEETGWSADTNYRFVASIREDFLFVLEDSIDENSLELYKNNRYRLRPMKTEQAKTVVLVPGKDCIEESQKTNVANRIVSLAKRNKDEIDTLLLSLVCSGTFNKKSGEKISMADLDIWKSNPMEVYYHDAVRGLTADQIRYIQQHFIREDGSRRRVDVNEVKTALGDGIYTKLTQGRNRLFSLSDKGQVELLHDQLGIAVFEERKAFEERERKEKFRRRITVIGVIVLAIVGTFLFQNHRLKQQRWRMLENQSRFVAEKVISLAPEDSYLARILALEILPKNLSHPNRPYTPEAEQALRNACEYNSVIFRNKGSQTCNAKLSPDNKQLITYPLYPSGLVITINTWDVFSGSRINTIRLKNNSIYGMVFSDDGQLFATTRSSDSTLTIYETETGKELISMENSSKWVKPLAFSPDCKMIATLVYKDSTLLVRSTSTGEVLLRAKEPWANIGFNVASFSPDGKLIASAYSMSVSDGYTVDNFANRNDVCSNNTITIRNIENQDTTNTWQGHTNLITSISFSPDGNQILTSSYDGTTRVWETQTGKELLRSSNTYWSQKQANFSPDGRHIVASCYDGTIVILDAVTGEEVERLLGHNSVVNSAFYSMDGNMIVSCSVDNTVRLWNLQQSDKATTIIAKTNIPIGLIDLSPDAKKIATMYDDTTLFVMDLESGEKTLELHLSPGRYPHPVSFSPDGESIISNSDYRTLKIWNVANGEVQDSLTGLDLSAYSVAFSPDGKKVVSALNYGHLGIWEISNNNQPQELNRRRGSISTALFSPDGEMVFLPSSGSFNIDVINAQTYKEKMSFSGHTSAVNSVAFSPDYKTIVSTSRDKTLRIWNLETNSCLKVLEGHTDGVNQASYSPSGKLIASASNDNTIRIWDVASGGCVHVLEGHTNAVTFVEFLDEEHIISASLDSTIRQWTFTPLQELIDQTHERYKDRPLTYKERKMYYME